MKEIKRVFKVEGKPFFPVGGQSCNSSGYNAKESEMAFHVIKLLHGNTLEIPVYWDQIEPGEGCFDFTSVDSLLTSALKHEVKLILLWFATWKNGNMDYAPSWVKTDPQRFKRVISPTGGDIWNLSSHCQANLEADRKAFTELCKYLKAKDTKQTVIGLQIENESGIVGSDRDYGREAQAVYNSPVPAKLVKSMKKAGKGPVYDLWQKAGGIKSGTWPQMFGWEGGELMTAWSIANYIDRIAESGKAVYDIPMYVNVWVMEQPWWAIPGESYPSGGAVTRVLDIYKWFTPHLDMIAPDNYHSDLDCFRQICSTYARDDNPFFMPETTGDMNMFRAIADYNSIGNFFFGIEYILNEDGTVRPECQPMIDNVRCTAAVIPLLIKFQGTGKIHSINQDEQVPAQLLDLGDFTGLIEFGEKKAPYVGKDWRHMAAIWLSKAQTSTNTGCGLVIQSGRNEFYLVGANYRLYLRPKPGLEKINIPLLIADGTAKLLAYTVSVDEGHFNRNGEFITDRRRNGDEISRGIWVEANVGVVRVIMCD
jgi:Domain of unknown function (DUF5597)